MWNLSKRGLKRLDALGIRAELLEELHILGKTPSRQNLWLQQEYLFFIRIKNSTQQWIPCLHYSGFPKGDVSCWYWFCGLQLQSDKLHSSCGLERVRTSHLLLCLCIAGSSCSGLSQVLETHTSAEPREQSGSPPYCCSPRISHIPKTCHDCVPLPPPSRSWTQTTQFKFKCMCKDEFLVEFSCVNTNSGAQKVGFIQCPL